MRTEERLITVITALVVLAVMLVAPVSQGAQIAGASPGIHTYDFPAFTSAFSDSFEVDLSKWDDNGTTDWDFSTSRYHHGSQSVRADGDNDGHATTYLADCTGTIPPCEHRTCTITNNDQAATLTVYKQVTNDDGGTASPGDWQIHVKDSSNSEVAGSPQAGSSTGTTYTLNPGTYTVSETGGPGGYSASFSGDCDGSGNITLAMGDNDACTITNDDEEQAPVQAVISLTKTATDGAGQEVTEAHVGDTIVYVFEVENPGVPSLISVTLTDDTGICDADPVRGAGKVGDNDDTLEPGEIWVYTCSHVVTAGDPDPLDNHATVSGTPTVAGTLGTAEATSTVHIISSKDPVPVGGMVAPVNKATLLTPWIALFGGIPVCAVILTRRRARS